MTGPESSLLQSPVEPVLDGSWEHGGRSTNAAALMGLLGIGIVYFYGQSFLVFIGMSVSGILTPAGEEPGGFLERMMHDAENSKTPIRLATVVTQYALMLAPAWWVVRRWHSSDAATYMRATSTSSLHVLLGVASAVFFFPTNVYLSGLFVRALNIPDSLTEINQAIVTSSTLGEFVWVTFAIAVTPAICEETLFRGFAQRTFERAMGWKSILLVGCVFGLFHMQPLGLLSLSGLGFLFGYLYFVSKSLLPSMAAHFTNNFLVTVLLFRPLDLQRSGLFSLPFWIAAVTLPICAGVLYLFYKVSVTPVSILAPPNPPHGS
jgi:membrane protease YdiL (CAAX protease family)